MVVVIVIPFSIHLSLNAWDASLALQWGLRAVVVLL